MSIERIRVIIPTERIVVHSQGFQGKPGTPGAPGPAATWATIDHPEVFPPDIGPGANQAVAGNNPALTDSRTPTGAAGGVLSGTYPAPGFAVPMATVSEMEAAVSAALAQGEAAISAALVGVSKVKTPMDASGNPLYPTAVIGDSYVFTVAGKIGGADGEPVEAGDSMYAIYDTAEGTHAAVGGNWCRQQKNLPGMTPVGVALSIIATPIGERYLRVNADGTVSLLTQAELKTAAGLGSVDNTSDADKPVSTAQAAAIAAVTKTSLGLGNVDNTTDANKPVSTATATALGGKAPTSLVGSPVEVSVYASDLTTAITAGTGKVSFRTPFAMTLTAVRASLVTAQTSGSIFTVDINEGGVSVLSTKLTIDNTEKTSVTAATAAVISDAALADDAEISVDVDQVGDGTAKGLFITLIGTRA